MEWSYDYDGNTLLYDWQCFNFINSISNTFAMDCNNMITPSLSSPIINIEFDHDNITSFVVNETYIYQFILTVKDANIISRESCQSFIEIQLNIIMIYPN